MKGSTYTVAGILVGGVAIALLIKGLNQGEGGAEGDDGSVHRNGGVAPRVGSPDSSDGRARMREPKFESVEEAEQALLDFDMSFIRAGDKEEGRRGLYRLRSLAGRIPEAYYGELTSRFGEGSANDLNRYFLQMAVYQEWGRVDLEAALVDVSGIEEEPRYFKALHSAFVGAVDSDAAAAMERVLTIEIHTSSEFGDLKRIDLMDSVFDTWIESDPFSALEWAREAPVPDKRRDQWVRDGLQAWTEQDPEAAERWRQQGD